MAQRQLSSQEFFCEEGRRLLNDDETNFFDFDEDILSDPEEDHLLVSEHDTQSDVSFDDSEADPDFLPSSGEESGEDASRHRKRTRRDAAASAPAPVASSSSAAVPDPVASGSSAAAPDPASVPVAAVTLGAFFGAKDGTKWYSTPRRTERIECDDNQERPSPRATIQPTNALEAFSLFITDNMLNKIVAYTNEKLAQMRQQFQRDRDAAPTNIMEIRAIIGLMFVMGLHQSGHTNIDSVWANDGFGIEVCRLIMTQRRFRQLLLALRFDEINEQSRARRLELDNLAKIREFWTDFNNNCIRCYKPGCHVTVDEMLVAFNGNCQFRQYIKSKAAKYGIKIHALCDAETFYCLNTEIYCGDQPAGSPYTQSNRPTDIVLRLTEIIAGSNRTVTCDNWYTSLELAIALSNRRINLVGTINKARRFIPDSLLSANSFAGGIKSTFFFNEHATIAAFRGTASKKVVPLLSTRPDHGNQRVNANGAPIINQYYNKYKSGVDTLDRMKVNYSISRASRRWPLTLFFAALNMVTINAHIVLRARLNMEISRRTFINELARSLMYDQARHRATTIQMQPAQRERINSLFPPRNEEEAAAVLGTRTERAGRCYLCSSAANRRSTVQCTECNRFMCGEHRVLFCTACAANL